MNIHDTASLNKIALEDMRLRTILVEAIRSLFPVHQQDDYHLYVLNEESAQTISKEGAFFHSTEGLTIARALKKEAFINSTQNKKNHKCTTLHFDESLPMTVHISYPYDLSSNELSLSEMVVLTKCLRPMKSMIDDPFMLADLGLENASDQGSAQIGMTHKDSDDCVLYISAVDDEESDWFRLPTPYDTLFYVSITDHNDGEYGKVILSDYLQTSDREVYRQWAENAVNMLKQYTPVKPK
jgi:hypothetical protein